MTDMEFVEMTATFYQTELKRTGNPIKASKAAERYRSAMIVALATQAAIKAGLIDASGNLIRKN